MRKTPTGAKRPAKIDNDLRVTKAEFERLKRLEQETRKRIEGFGAEPLVPREELYDRGIGHRKG